MWCLAGNPDVEVHEGDFRTISAVPKKLADADVVVSPPYLSRTQLARFQRLIRVACQ